MTATAQEVTPLRTLQIVSVVAPSFGGPSIGALALHASLRQMGNDARLVTNAYATPAGGTLSPKERCEIESERENSLVWLDPSWPFRLQRGRSTLLTLWREVGRAEVVHIHGQYMWIHAAACIVLCLRRRPFGLQPHGGLEPFQLGVSRRKKAIFNYLFGSRLLRRASYFLFASNSEAQRAANISLSRGLVVPLGADLAPAVRTERAHAWLGDRDRKNCYVFLGRLATKKRLDLLVRAWSRARRAQDAILVIAGPPGDESLESVRALALREHADDSILVVGAVTGGEKTWLLEHCGVFVLPSDNENFGVAVAEAMLAGCYCVVSDQVAANEHVLAAGGGVTVRAGDIEDLISTLERVSDTDALTLRAAGEANRRYAIRHLTWSGAATKLDAQMRSIVRSRSAGREAP